MRISDTVEDLGLDSLALAEIGEIIGQRAGRDIAPEEVADLRTVADLQRIATQAGGSGRIRMPSYAKFAEPYTLALPAPLKWLGRSMVRGAERESNSSARCAFPSASPLTIWRPE